MDCGREATCSETDHPQRARREAVGGEGHRGSPRGKANHLRERARQEAKAEKEVNRESGSLRTNIDDISRAVRRHAAA